MIIKKLKKCFKRIEIKRFLKQRNKTKQNKTKMKINQNEKKKNCV